MSRILMLLLVASGTAVAQNKTPTAFVLDEGKPYVFIAFDHAGKRQPVFPDESHNGVWFNFVNNCRVPITISTADTGTDDPGVAVVHDVVPIPDSGFRGFPEPAGTQSKPVPEPPEGYSENIEVRTAMTLNPGKSVLFSVPLEHLGPHWFIQVKFTLEVSKLGIDQPSSYAVFRWEKLPAKVRDLSK